ncbi:MAG: ATP-binding cassette domain-containing protein [Gammaproteobacteria bacterium]|nr:ATP-binding cassette domain-containing protein [Gammaproteobacteria bacterium]
MNEAREDITAASADRPGGPPLLSAQGLGQRVQMPGAEPLTILSDIDLRIDAGERVAVIGTSGSGKTTLLGLLAGLDLPSEGQVWLDGVALGQLDEDQRARLRAGRIGFVFQSFQLIQSFTALENVMLPLELLGHAQPPRRAREILGRVGLGSRLNHYPRQLSGGEQQRVAIARAFVAEPALLMADEPTGNLDARTGERIAELLFDLNRERGTTLVLVTHDENLAAQCDRRVRIDGGELRESA